MDALPTLYKARNLPLKRPVCAICVDRTRGRTEEVRLGHRVTVWVCPGHAVRAFQTKRGERDFVRTLMGVWQANGRLTAARHGALDAHLAQLRARPPRKRRGSYTWPALHRPHSEPAHAPAMACRAPLAHRPALGAGVVADPLRDHFQALTPRR